MEEASFETHGDKEPKDEVETQHTIDRTEGHKPDAGKSYPDEYQLSGAEFVNEPSNNRPLNAALQSGQRIGARGYSPGPAELGNHRVKESAKPIEYGTNAEEIEEAAGGDDPPAIEDPLRSCRETFDSIHKIYCI